MDREGGTNGYWEGVSYSDVPLLLLLQHGIVLVTRTFTAASDERQVLVSGTRDENLLSGLGGFQHQSGHLSLNNNVSLNMSEAGNL